jgi:hypothetical protein
MEEENHIIASEKSTSKRPLYEEVDRDEMRGLNNDNQEYIEKGFYNKNISEQEENKLIDLRYSKRFIKEIPPDVLKYIVQNSIKLSTVKKMGYRTSLNKIPDSSEALKPVDSLTEFQKSYMEYLEEQKKSKQEKAKKLAAFMKKGGEFKDFLIPKPNPDNRSPYTKKLNADFVKWAVQNDISPEAFAGFKGWLYGSEGLGLPVGESTSVVSSVILAHCEGYYEQYLNHVEEQKERAEKWENVVTILLEKDYPQSFIDNSDKAFLEWLALEKIGDGDEGSGVWFSALRNTIDDINKPIRLISFTAPDSLETSGITNTAHIGWIQEKIREYQQGVDMVNQEKVSEKDIVGFSAEKNLESTKESLIELGYVKEFYASAPGMLQGFIVKNKITYDTYAGLLRYIQSFKNSSKAFSGVSVYRGDMNEDQVRLFRSSYPEYLQEVSYIPDAEEGAKIIPLNNAEDSRSLRERLRKLRFMDKAAIAFIASAVAGFLYVNSSGPVSASAQGVKVEEPVSKKEPSDSDLAIGGIPKGAFGNIREGNPDYDKRIINGIEKSDLDKEDPIQPVPLVPESTAASADKTESISEGWGEKAGRFFGAFTDFFSRKQKKTVVQAESKNLVTAPDNSEVVTEIKLADVPTSLGILWSNKGNREVLDPDNYCKMPDLERPLMPESSSDTDGETDSRITNATMYYTVVAEYSGYAGPEDSHLGKKFVPIPGADGKGFWLTEDDVKVIKKEGILEVHIHDRVYYFNHNLNQLAGIDGPVGVQNIPLEPGVTGAGGTAFKVGETILFRGRRVKIVDRGILGEDGFDEYGGRVFIKHINPNTFAVDPKFLNKYLPKNGS